MLEVCCVVEDTGSGTDGEIVPRSSTSRERKRAHEYCFDAHEAEFSPNKRQAAEYPMSNTSETKPNKKEAPCGFPPTCDACHPMSKTHNVGPPLPQLQVDTGRGTDGETGRERKRAHGAEFSPNKSQAVESPSITDYTLETKPKKKELPCLFPSSVRSLTSTGIFDGVPVKYISRTREELRGVIKCSGYNCGCQTCKFSQVLTAKEFGHHAGDEIKHPNYRIYFKNGKSIYDVVQELRCTPESLLFERIQTSTGSPTHQENFCAWKVSFQAAGRELERIVGKSKGRKGNLVP